MKSHSCYSQLTSTLGKMKIETKKGTGSQFIVLLPAVQ